MGGRCGAAWRGWGSCDRGGWGRNGTLPVERGPERGETGFLGGGGGEVATGNCLVKRRSGKTKAKSIY